MTSTDVRKWRRAASCSKNGQCIEFAPTVDGVAVRDSKAPDDVLRFTRAEIAAFLESARAGEFDDLV